MRLRRGFIVFGAAFGFVLSRAGATSYEYYSGLFLFTDLQLLWVIAAAACVGAIGIQVMKRVGAKAVTTKRAIQFRPKPWTPTLLPGALLLGLGWGLAGACPGTVLAMLGEGRLPAVVTIAGILFGTWLHGVMAQRASRGGGQKAEAVATAL